MLLEVLEALAIKACAGLEDLLGKVGHFYKKLKAKFW
jgi:hypothetical protein